MTLTQKDQHILHNWEEMFLLGDHSNDEFCINVFRNEIMDDDIPVLFSCISNIAALKFLDTNGVNLLQRSLDGSTLLMEKTPEFDDDAYRWLVEKFKNHKALDLADDEGITPLSTMIKFGQLDKARILLENGASVDSYAEISRYGGSRLDIPTQAINCVALGKSDNQDTAISALKLLRDFGYTANAQQKQDFLERTKAQKPKVHEWISLNL
ncbi:ankyrin repeat domain-containing protein [Agrobacterium rosae]|uniref:Ankyrin repeat domain-containing protein n=1 Tax=Agrobacterium rosae TaxID=1972867 RepID=A0AAW9FJP9_9HYPH|nr:ankyrin repeat domain-containing protein [Agrobacterium rosae]MDX8304643.1 ankyrin repeat domain-containing protein [Agrobacterium rosae]